MANDWTPILYGFGQDLKARLGLFDLKSIMQVLTRFVFICLATYRVCTSSTKLRLEWCQEKMPALFTTLRLSGEKKLYPLQKAAHQITVRSMARIGFHPMPIMLSLKMSIRGRVRRALYPFTG